jgi:dTDP-4-amino-4,6-dideoxygalactose transaminase
VRNGRRAGSVGALAAFSFYPAKNLGAFGEGGAVTTSSAQHAELVRVLRDHGQRRKHDHAEVGTNARLSSIQCAALSVRLEHLDEYNQARRRHAARYRAGLDGVAGVRLVAEDPAGVPVYHLFVVRVAERDRVARALADAGIATAIHYPVPIHRQPAYASLGLGDGSYPVAERAAAEILSLPMYPEMSEAAVDYVVDRLRAAV